MILQFAAFSLLWFAQSERDEKLDAAYGRPNVLVVVADVKHYTRSSGLNFWEDGEEIYVSNSCGYDTATLVIRQVLLGKYLERELSAHLKLGEWCEGFWQDSMNSYMVHLEWDGNVWVVIRELSSPVIHQAGKSWIIEPALVENLRSAGLPVGPAISLSRGFRVKLSKERLMQVGIEPERGSSWKDAVAENASRCQIPGKCWTSAPMSFGAAIDVKSLASCLSSNYMIKPTAEQALRTDCGPSRRCGLSWR